MNNFLDNLAITFQNEGLFYANWSQSKSKLTTHRKFRAFYGVSPDICSILWALLKKKPKGSKPKHLLWCLLFLKCYGTEHLNCAIVKVDEKTFRIWTWKFINMLAELTVVNWQNRHKDVNNQTNMYVSLDGTDFRIFEPTPFNKKWYSHKFKGPGIRYEIGLAIKTGDIVWASGGLPCGEWPDLKIAKECYCCFVENEITLADKGYRDNNYFKNPTNTLEKRILARHETVNGRLKEFNILKNRFRHPLKKHPKVFHACVNILQVAIQNGEPLFRL